MDEGRIRPQRELDRGVEVGRCSNEGRRDLRVFHENTEQQEDQS